jgi:magnesium chelatase family protein
MLAKLHTFSLLGIEAIQVDVEVDVSPATSPMTILVGLPEAAVKESTHRVERASLPDQAAAGNRHSDFRHS